MNQHTESPEVPEVKDSKPTLALKEGIEVIRLKKNWTTGSYARDNAGRPQLAWDVKATCWCSLGALQKVTRMSDFTGFNELVFAKARQSLNEAALELSKNGSATVYNDIHSHEEVLKMWEKAIEISEAKDKAGFQI